MSDAIRVNGVEFDYGSITVKVAGEKYHGFTGIKYSQKRERGKMYGTNKARAPRGRSRGKYSAEAGLTGPIATMAALRKQLADLNDGQNYGDTEFLVTVQYVDKGNEPILVEICECCIASEDDGHDDGSNDPLNEEVALDVMYIKKNGLTLFDNSDGVR